MFLWYVVRWLLLPQHWVVDENIRIRMCCIHWLTISSFLVFHSKPFRIRPQRKYYTVFDYGQQRLGFALAK